MWAPGQDRQPDHVDVFLERSRGDHLGRLAQAGVDDLEAFVAQAAGEHLRATIVAIEAGLGDEDLDRAIGHGPIVGAARNEGGPLERADRLAQDAEVRRPRG